MIFYKNQSLNYFPLNRLSSSDNPNLKDSVIALQSHHYSFFCRTELKVILTESFLSFYFSLFLPFILRWNSEY